MSLNIITFDNNTHKYFEFSNYYPQELKIKVKNKLNGKDEEIIFNSIEQYYQSEKYNTNNSLSQLYRHLIIEANTPKKAHMIGKQKKFIYDWTINDKSKLTVKGVIDKYKGKIKIRDDWDKVKSDILMKGLKEKFKDIKLKRLLLSTGSKVIVENSIGIWGMKNNKLGDSLMKIRDKLMKNQK